MSVEIYFLFLLKFIHDGIEGWTRSTNQSRNFFLRIGVFNYGFTSYGTTIPIIFGQFLQKFFPRVLASLKESVLNVVRVFNRKPINFIDLKLNDLLSRINSCMVSTPIGQTDVWLSNAMANSSLYFPRMAFSPNNSPFVRMALTTSLPSSV